MRGRDGDADGGRRRPPPPRLALRRQLRAARRDALRARRRRRPAAPGRQRARRLQGPVAARDRLPGLPADITRNLVPAADDARIVDIDYCVNGRAIHHLGPLEDVFIREWTPEGALAGMTLAIGRFAKSAFAAKAADIPVLHDKLSYILDGLHVAKNSHAWREARAIFNHFPKRELFYARREDLCTIVEQMVNLVGDDEIAVAVRQGTGYAAVTVAFSDVRYSPSAEDALRGVAAAGLRPDPLQRVGRPRQQGRHHLLLRRGGTREPDRRREGAGADASGRDDLGGSGRPGTREGLRHDRGTPAVQQVRAVREPQRPLPRVHDAAGSARRPRPPRGARGTPGDERPAGIRRPGHDQALRAHAAQPDRHPADARQPRASRWSRNSPCR